MKEYIDTQTGEYFTEADLNGASRDNLEQIYYTTFERDSLGPLMVSHDTEEEARAYAEAHGLTYYERNGLCVVGFDKCQKCGAWVMSIYVDAHGICDDCNG